MSIIGKKYAIALFDLAFEKNILDDVYDDFSLFIETLNKNKKFSDLLLFPSLSTDEKKVMLENVFGKEMNNYLKNFLDILLDKNRFEHSQEIYQIFRKTYFENKGMVEAVVLSVHPMEDQLKTALKQKLEMHFDKKVQLVNQIDPSILGGAIVYIGEQVIDGSVRKQLDEIKVNMNNIRLH